MHTGLYTTVIVCMPLDSSCRRAFAATPLSCVICVLSVRMSAGSLVGELTTDVNSTVEHLKELGKMIYLF